MSSPPEPSSHKPRKFLLGLFLLGAAAATSSTTAAEQLPRQEFAVDLGAAAGLQPFDNAAVTRCFGSSHAATAMRADWQRELTAVQKDLGVEYVRFHGLLDDDMSVVVPGHLRKLAAAPPQKCTFVQDQDFRDAGANVVNASSKEQCCALCYTEPTGLPEPCVAAVFANGRCYFKIGDEKPYLKPESGVVACVTDRPSAKSYEYSWSNIFTVFDFLRSIDMRPIIEVSFMPELLAEYTNRTVFHYKGILSPPKHFSEWRDFMTAFGTALTERYGTEEVAKWYFEVWNEPNCCGGYPDTGCCGPSCGNQSMYVELFANTFKGLKAANSQLRVGGPATAQLAWIDAFVAGAAGAGAPPDFVSSHLYPTDPWANEVALSHTRDGFKNAIAAAADSVAASAKQHGMPPSTQFLLTEFNCGLGMDCADSFFSSSFIAYHALNSQGIVDRVPVQSYWT
jgi:beta-xylosidase